MILQKYQTSLTAASFKMIELTIFAVIFVCFKDGKVSYIKRSKEAETMGLWPEHGKLNVNTVASQLSSSQVQSGKLKAVYPESGLNIQEMGLESKNKQSFSRVLILACH